MIPYVPEPLPPLRKDFDSDLEFEEAVRAHREACREGRALNYLGFAHVFLTVAGALLFGAYALAGWTGVVLLIGIMLLEVAVYHIVKRFV